jgi:LmbE family N-acetylglucosaminyl deacetylase
MSPDTIPVARVLVIAPHPDDESLGCGGLIACLTRRASKFCFIFVTDGGASHVGSRSWPRRRLAARRKQETLEALKRLGAADAQSFFFGLPDSAIPPPASDAWEKTLAELTTIVRNFHPTLAVMPWRRDPHCDHRDSWLLATKALKRADARPVILEYAIWLDELGTSSDRPQEGESKTVTIDIGAVLSEKRAAIAAHETQTTALIDDDPEGFRLSAATIARLTMPTETYWRPVDETD